MATETEAFVVGRALKRRSAGNNTRQEITVLCSLGYELNERLWSTMNSSGTASSERDRCLGHHAAPAPLTRVSFESSGNLSHD